MGYSPPVQKNSAGLAIAALVLGICGFVPVLGLLAALLGIIFGGVVLATKRPGRGMAVGGLAAGIVSLVVMVGLGVLGSLLAVRVGQTAGQVTVLPAVQTPPVSSCMTRLAIIGSAMQLYTSDRGGQFPATLQDLTDGGQLSQVEAEMCPSSSPAGDEEYFYLPPPAGAGGTVIVACDLTSNHGGNTRGVLYASGQVVWIPDFLFQQMLAQPPNAAFAKALAEAEAP